MPLTRILLIRTGALGDFIVTLPVIHALRNAYPDAHIQLLGNLQTLALAREEVDRIDSIDRADWASFFVPGGRLPAPLADPLSATDLVLSYLPDPNGTFSTNLKRTGARTVVSFPPHPPTDGSIHIVDHLLLPLHKLQIPVTEKTPTIHRTPADHDAAEQTRSDDALEQPMLLVHPGSGGRHKCWPKQHFAEAADHFRSETGHTVGLLSGPADGDLAQQVASRMKGAATVLPPMPLRPLAGLLQRAGAYLGNDSGPSHLAAAVGTPTVALFGPTDPRIWAPRGKAVRVIGGPAHLPPEKRLAAISPPRVATVLSRLLPPSSTHD